MTYVPEKAKQIALVRLDLVHKWLEFRRKSNIKIQADTEDLINEGSEFYAKDRYENIFKGYDLDFKYCCKESLKLFNEELYKL